MKVADVLRGSMDASEYKEYIFGMLFVKRMSDVFDEKRREMRDVYRRETPIQKLWRNREPLCASQETIMPVPTYEELLQPTLEAFRQLGGLQSIVAINSACGSAEGVDPLPAIERYQRAVGLLIDEVDVEPPASYARHDFLAKTYLRAEQADDLYDNPAYSYEDFIEGIRTESKRTDEGRFMVDYPPRAGVFRRFCRIAQANPDQPHVFIIDEINRGDIPRIFGELMLLLEYRERDVPLPDSGERFRIPPNVYLIGTMNTADRSIALVDFALRRRFHFVHFRADPDLLERWLAQHPVPIPYLAAY